jgi:hypothetical protein
MWPCLYVSCDDPLTLPHFIVIAKTDSSLLLGGLHDQPWLICEDETSGCGADEIELNISVDGRDVRYINDEIVEMEQDAVRDLYQVPEFVPYPLGEGFRMIELNDIDSNDIGPQTLPPHDQPPRTQRCLESRVPNRTATFVERCTSTSTTIPMMSRSW